MYSSLIVAISLVVISSFNGCTACKCVQLADESKICLSDFAISGTLLETNSTAGQVDYIHDDMIEYRVSVNKVYRSSGSLPTTMTISTETHTCGFTDLQVNATYFIAGHSPRSGMYHISRCSAVVAKYRPDNIPYRGAKYGPDNIPFVPYRVPDVKVNVNVTCPAEAGENKDNSAKTLTFNIALLAMVALYAGILKMF